jgi:hypothetical protein
MLFQKEESQHLRKVWIKFSIEKPVLEIFPFLIVGIEGLTVNHTYAIHLSLFH